MSTPQPSPIPQVFPSEGYVRTWYSEQHPHLETVARQDVEGLLIAEEKYGDSWKRRGGVGAFMMLARKWDRLEEILRKAPRQYDVLNGITDGLASNEEGCLDAVRDLRRYLLLVEAELLRGGASLPLQRDNEVAEKRRERNAALV